MTANLNNLSKSEEETALEIGWRKSMYKMIIFYLFLLSFSEQVFAFDTIPNFTEHYKNQTFDSFQLEHLGNIYKFQTINIFNDKTEQKYGSIGRIVTLNSKGLEVSSQITRGTPGCAGKIPPIIVMNVAVFNGLNRRMRELLFFCSSDNLRQNVIRVYDPSYGFVSTLGFDHASESYSVIENRIFITVENEEHLSGAAWVYYPVVYEFKAENNTFGFNVIPITSERYKDFFISYANRYQQEKSKAMLARIFLLTHKYKLFSQYDAFKQNLGKEALQFLSHLKYN